MIASHTIILAFVCLLESHICTSFFFVTKRPTPNVGFGKESFQNGGTGSGCVIFPRKLRSMYRMVNFHRDAIQSC